MPVTKRLRSWRRKSPGCCSFCLSDALQFSEEHRLSNNSRFTFYETWVLIGRVSGGGLTCNRPSFSAHAYAPRAFSYGKSRQNPSCQNSPPDCFPNSPPAERAPQRGFRPLRWYDSMSAGHLGSCLWNPPALWKKGWTPNLLSLKRTTCALKIPSCMPQSPKTVSLTNQSRFAAIAYGLQSFSFGK